MSFRLGPEMNVANPTPTPPPVSIHGPQSFRNEMFTEPSLWCVKAALADATTMVARDVPTATNIISSDEYAKMPKTYSNAGTTIKPPPTPNKPLVNPAKQPEMSSKPNNKMCSIDTPQRAPNFSGPFYFRWLSLSDDSSI